MGRAERRRQAREIYKHTEQTLGEIKQQATREATIQTLRCFGVLGGLVLHDEFGFGGKRLDRFYNLWCNQIDALQKGYLSIEDARQTLIDECGIDLMLEDEHIIDE